MTKQFTIECECGRTTTFDRYDVPELGEYIDDRIERAADETRAEVEREFDGFIDPSELASGDRRDFDLFELSAAIRRGDREEAELLLDRMAAAMGHAAAERVQLGRFSPRARRAA